MNTGYIPQTTPNYQYNMNMGYPNPNYNGYNQYNPNPMGNPNVPYYNNNPGYPTNNTGNVPNSNYGGVSMNTKKTTPFDI
jgi:hypothetical protein